MSGELVGEVINSVPDLKARGISRSGYEALLAIAEKCYFDSREGSVPLSWIQSGTYGASESTARRAITELVTAELVVVVKPGARNRYGGRAPIYRLLALPTAMTTARDLADTTAMTTASGSSSSQNGSSSSHFSSSSSHFRSSSVIDPPLTSGASVLTEVNGSTNGSTNKREGASAQPAPEVSVELVLDGGVVGEQVSPPPKQKTARTRRAKTLLPEGWRPTAEDLDKLAAKYRALDVEDQLDAFMEKAEASGWMYANWSQAFAVFLRGGGIYTNTRNGNAVSSHSQKIAGWDDATAQAAQDLLGIHHPITTAINGHSQKEIR